MDGLTRHDTLSYYWKGELDASEISLAKKIPSKRWHFTYRNKLNGTLPSTEQQAINKGWKQKPVYETACHQFNIRVSKTYMKNETLKIYTANKKYLDGNREAIYYSDGTLNNSPEDRGSYNYVPHSVSVEGHVLADMVPWIAWGNSSRKYGNSKSDKTSTTQRYKKSSIKSFTNGINGIAVIARVGQYYTVR